MRKHRTNVTIQPSSSRSDTDDIELQAIPEVEGSDTEEDDSSVSTNERDLTLTGDVHDEEQPKQQEGVVKVPTKGLNKVNNNVLQQPQASATSTKKKKDNSKRVHHNDNNDDDDESSFDLEEETRKCDFSLWSYGFCNTSTSLITSMGGLLLSYLAKRSTEFTTVKESLAPKDTFMPLYKLGLYRIILCKRDLSEEESLSQALSMEGISQFVVLPPNPFVDEIDDPTLCNVYRLEQVSINDRLWDVSRLAGGLGAVLGMVVCIWIILSPCFEGINMRAVACTSLIVYFLESLTFIVFDSNVCHELGCSFGLGSYYGIASCVSWFICSISTIRMYLFHRDLLIEEHYAEEYDKHQTTKQKQEKLKKAQKDHDSVVLHMREKQRARLQQQQSPQ